MHLPNVLVLGDIPEIECKPLSRLKELANIIYLPSGHLSESEVQQRATEIQSKTPITVLLTLQHLFNHTYKISPDLLKPFLASLKFITKPGAGYENVDVDYLTKNAILFANCPKAVGTATAEWTVALMLSTVKNLNPVEANARAGRWRTGLLDGHGSFGAKSLGVSGDLFSKTLGIVGMGNIGKAVAERVAGWRMKIFYYSRTRLAVEDERKLNAEYVSFEELLIQADVISLHCPLTASNHHLFSSKVLSNLKKPIYLINTSRGKLIDEEALVQALKDGNVIRCGLDVFENEPEIHPWLKENPDRCVVTPHYAVFSEGTGQSMLDEIMGNAVDYIEGRTPDTVVNKLPV